MGKRRENSAGADRKQDRTCHKFWAKSQLCSGEGQRAGDTGTSWEMLPFNTAGTQKDECRKQHRLRVPKGLKHAALELLTTVCRVQQS